jgi:hypothetical protein
VPPVNFLFFRTKKLPRKSVTGFCRSPFLLQAGKEQASEPSVRVLGNIKATSSSK